MKDNTHGASRRNMLVLALESAQSVQASTAVTIALLKAELADDHEASKVYGLDEMAERRNLSANTLRSWAKAGRLRCSSGARKQYLTTDADVDAALAVDVPARTSLRKTEPSDRDDYDALEDALASGELVRGGK